MGKLNICEDLVYYTYRTDGEDVKNAVLSKCNKNFKICEYYCNLKYFSEYSASSEKEGIHKYFNDVVGHFYRLFVGKDSELYTYVDGVETKVRNIIEYIYHDGKIFIFEI